MKIVLLLVVLFAFNTSGFAQDHSVADFDSRNQLSFEENRITSAAIISKLSLGQSGNSSSSRDLLIERVRKNQSAVKQSVAPLKIQMKALLQQKKTLQSADNKSNLQKVERKIETLLSAYYSKKESELMFEESSIIPPGDSLNSRIAQRVVKTVELMNEKYQQIEPLANIDRNEAQTVCYRKITKIWLYPVKLKNGWQLYIVAKFKNSPQKVQSLIPDLELQQSVGCDFAEIQAAATKQGNIRVESSSRDLTPFKPTDRPKIMLTGYWNPTGQMIAPFSTDSELNPTGWIGSNWENLGYDIVSYFPKPDVYTGTFMVDYQDVTADFWPITQEVKPIALISFGAGNGPWEIEVNARNLTSWYADDVAPVLPTPNPPDNAKPTGYNRLSTLPVADIAALVNDSTTINAWVDWNGNPGKYLCEYMAYHDKWYYELNRLNPDFPCLASGFIHALNTIPVTECRKAVNATLRATISHLNKFIPIAGQVNIPGQPAAGTYINIKGSENLTFVVTDASGAFSLPCILPGTYQISAVKAGVYYASQQIIVSASSNFFTIDLKDWSSQADISYHQTADQIYRQTGFNPQEVAIKITPEEFSGWAGGILDKIRFYTPLSSDSCTMAMIVYSSTLQSTTPTTLEYVKTVDYFGADQWFEHYLQAPVVLDPQKNYWLGYRISSTVSKKVGWLDNAAAVANKGSWLRSNAAWSSTLVTHNWLIDCSVYKDVTAIENQPLPAIQYLHNYPNPFNPTTTITFNLTKKADTALTVYNSKGELVKTLLSGVQNAGEYSVTFDGTGLNSGVYFYKLEADGKSVIKRMLMLK